jgi:hypothetical protein
LLTTEAGALVLPPLTDALPLRITILAEEVLHTMTLLKLKCVAALGLMIAGFATLIGMLGMSGLGSSSEAIAQQPSAPPAKEQPAEKPKPAAKAKDDFDDKVRKCADAAIAWLKQNRNKEGNWETGVFESIQRGGSTALAVLALLEAGVKPDDVDLIPAINYLRQLEPQHVYVVSLQTAVFCRLNEKKDADLISRNVAWLEKALVRKEGRLQGWSYSIEGQRADNSNTQYAIMALHRAAQAGFKPENKELWNEVRAAFVAGQHQDGGWGYMFGVSPTSTQTMTLAGLCNLLICDEMAKPTKESKTAIETGFNWVGQRFQIRSGGHTFYNLHCIARCGKLSGKKTFDDPGGVKHDWYRKGAAWLSEQQQKDGRLVVKGPGADSFPVISTSFALLFLSAKD